MIDTGSHDNGSIRPPGQLEQTAIPTHEKEGHAHQPKPFWLKMLQRAFVYFSIYVLSLGPMYWQWWEGKYLHGSKLIAAFYEPLFLLTDWVPPLGWFVNSYVHLWVFELKWTV